jgi:hypothetical protein
MTRTILILAAISFFPAANLGGQEASHPAAMVSVMFSSGRIGAGRIERTTLTGPDSHLIAREEKANSRHLWKYLVGGVAIGAVIGGSAVALANQKCHSSETCLNTQGAFIVGGGLGAILGAFVGLLGYADPYPNTPER